MTPKDLHPSARNELKTLSKENAERVARHLAFASQLLDEDPQLAHEHTLAASRHAARVGVVRESVAVTAYKTGDFALALRELRTYRRMTGRDDQIALLVDSERGVGRPDRALEEGRGVDRARLTTAARAGLAIAMSGARLDLGQTELALAELDIPELDPDRAFAWSPDLFRARAQVLMELGREEEAASWLRRAEVAEDALGLTSDDDLIEVIDAGPDDESGTGASSSGSAGGPSAGSGRTASTAESSVPGARATVTGGTNAADSAVDGAAHDSGAGESHAEHAGVDDRQDPDREELDRAAADVAAPDDAVSTREDADHDVDAEAPEAHGAPETAEVRAADGRDDTAPGKAARDAAEASAGSHGDDEDGVEMNGEEDRPDGALF